MPAAAAVFVAGTALALPAGTVGYAAAYAVTYAATAAAISFAASSLLAPSANRAGGPVSRGAGQTISNAQGVIGGAALSNTVRQSAAARRLIYGTIKTGGVLLYAKKTPNERYLHLAVYLGEGPISGIGSTIYLGDRNSAEPELAGLITAEVFTGAAGQTHSTSLAAVSEGEWSSAMVGQGVAYVHTRYEYSGEATGRIGPVLPAFLVNGRLCFDPRSNTTAFTNNPALVCLDFVRSEFGYRAADAFIDFDSFAAAANVCDEIVTSIDSSNVVGGTAGRVRRYSFNGVLEVDAGPDKSVKAIEASCGGQLVRVGGRYRFYAGAYRAPTGPTLTAEYLREAPAMRTHPGRQQRYNVARGTYIDPRQDWQATSFHDQVLSAAIVSEAGEIVQSVNLAAVTNAAQAQRLARQAMMRARSAVPLILKCNYAGMLWQPHDVIDLDLPEIGVSGPHLIVQTEYPNVGGLDGGIDHTVVPHLASDYVWDAATMERLTETVVAPNMDFPAPAATGLGVLVQTLFYNGSDQVDRLLYWRWDEPDWAILSHYELQVKEGAGDWVTYQVSEPRWTTEASPDFAYTARFRNVGINDKRSDWSAEETVDVYLSEDPAGTASSVSVSGDTLHIIAWTNPGSDNFKAMRVLTVDGPGLGSPTVITEPRGRPGARMQVTSAYAAGTHYALQSVSVDGALGSLVYAGEGTGDTSAYVTEQLDPINTAITGLDGRVSALESP